MKKNLAKITAIVSVIIGVTFFALLLTASFGGISAREFDNGVVRALMFVLGGCYGLTAIAPVWFQCAEKITVREIRVSQNNEGAVKVTPAVVRKLIRKNLRKVEGVKLLRASLSLSEFGVRLSITVSYGSGRRVEETSDMLRALIADVCERELDLTFHDITVKVVGFKSVYVPDVKALTLQVAENLGKEPIIKPNPEPTFIDADEILNGVEEPIMTEEEVVSIWSDEKKDVQPESAVDDTKTETETVSVDVNADNDKLI